MKKGIRRVMVVTLLLVLGITLAFMSLMVLVFFGVGVVVGVFFIPVYVRSHTYKTFILQMYEMERSIIGTLKMEQYKTPNNDGWMHIHELFTHVSKDFRHEDKKKSISLFKTTLRKLVRDEVIFEGETLCIFLNGDIYEGVFVLVYKWNPDSNYTPRKPRRLPEKKTEKAILPDGLPA